MTLEDKLITAFENALIKMISDGTFIQPKYENRLIIDPQMIKDVWLKVDKNKVITYIASRVDNQLADSIFNSMAIEIKNDVKQIMSNNDLREDIRILIKDRINQASKALNND